MTATNNNLILSTLFTVLILIISLAISGCSEPENAVSVPRELNIYNWEDYFGETTLDDFQKETGIKVNLYTFDDEKLMQSDVQTNPDKYDIIILSGELVEEMAAMKLLTKIDHQKIQNLVNIAPEFMSGYYDQGNIYSVPYLWGTTGVIINTKYFSEDSHSWSVLFDHNKTAEFKGRISLLNNPEEVIGAALKYLGYPLVASDTTQLDSAAKTLSENKEFIRGFEDPITIRDAMVSEDLWAAQQYSGEALSAMDLNEDLLYYIPSEGAAKWVDNMAIPVDAKNKEEAHMFIEYILRPEVSADIANYIWYANTNTAAKEFTDQEILSDPSLYPDPEVSLRLESFNDNSLMSEYNKVWSEIQQDHD